MQLKISSPKAAASANVPCEAFAPLFFTQAAAFSLLAEREPIFTSCPSATSLLPIVSPTIPVPRTAIFMAVPP